MFFRFENRRLWILLLALVSLTALAVAIHLVPFADGVRHPFGYDTGFYRRYLIEPLVSFPNTPVPGLGTDALVPRLILDSLHMLPLSPEMILYGTYIAFFALLPILTFLFMRQRAGERAAYFAALLLILSPIQYQAYWFMFWKNAWALLPFFFAFICIERRWWLLLCAADVVIALSHKTTAIIYLATLIVFALINKESRKNILLHALLTMTILLMVGFPAISGAIRISPEAAFIEWGEYAVFSIPFALIILSFFLLRRWTWSVPPIFVAFVLASFSFPVLHLPFYQRIFVFSDIGLAILAGLALDAVLRGISLEKIRLANVVALLLSVAGVGLLTGSLVSQLYTISPLVPPINILRIQEIGMRVPREGTILTSTQEAPWFEGFTLAHVAAPGMLHDNHTLEEWEAFWTSTSTHERAKFLESLPQPLYIATLEDTTQLLGTSSIPCLRQISPYLLYNECAAQIDKSR